MQRQLATKDKHIGRAAQALIGWWLKDTEESDGWHVTENMEVPDSHPDFTLRRKDELMLVEAKGKSEFSYTNATHTNVAGIERRHLRRYVEHSENGTMPVYILFYIVDKARLYGITLEHIREFGRGPFNERLQTDWTRYTTWFVPESKMMVLDGGDHLRARYDHFYQETA